MLNKSHYWHRADKFSLAMQGSVSEIRSVGSLDSVVANNRGKPSNASVLYESAEKH
jgi:hypothetical protein